MTGFILAAGLGTRMKELTEKLPKALVEVGGMTMLERTVRRLVDAGATWIVVNVHHHADQMKRALQGGFGLDVDIVISDESNLLLDTGGAVKHAAPLLAGNEPFFIHNVDVLSDCDLRAMYQSHLVNGSLATLGVIRRDNTRYLLVDSDGFVCGHGNSATGNEVIARTPYGESERVGFCGIHVVSPETLNLITESGAFSIISLYMRLIREGRRISAHFFDDSMWMDIGSPERLQIARDMM